MKCTCSISPVPLELRQTTKARTPRGLCAVRISLCTRQFNLTVTYMDGDLNHRVTIIKKMWVGL